MITHQKCLGKKTPLWRKTGKRKQNKKQLPVIPATQEAEIKRIKVQSQPRQIVCEILSRKTLHKNRAGGVAQGESPEFKPQYCKKKRN
jgi:hypothetical protein